MRVHSFRSALTLLAAVAGVADASDFWLGSIKHQGVTPYAASDYTVFRNVRDYGAKGDGVSDDTDAINRAITSGGRCGQDSCNSTTTTPALVYFPSGTYVVSEPIVDYYYTQIIGNPSDLPVLKLSPTFKERYVIDGNTYKDNETLSWVATNIFWRQIHNLEIDFTAANSSLLVAGIHWPTGQATSIENVVFRMSSAPGTKHQGIHIEEGSGGYVGDLAFYGGAQGLDVGNQQFTMRNLSFHGCATAVRQNWCWGWTYTGVSIDNCGVGFDFTGTKPDGNISVGSAVVLDSDIRNTPVGVVYGNSTAAHPPAANSIILENIRLDNVSIAVKGPVNDTLVPGSSGKTSIAGWGRGHSYQPTGPTKFQGEIRPNERPAGLVSGDNYYVQSKPRYEHEPLSSFVSVRDHGAKGDGKTDDTAALNQVFADAASAGKIVFIDAGIYVVTSTVKIPPGSKIHGEAFPVILSSGKFFSDWNNPKPVVQVGEEGEEGHVQWSDTIISTRGAQAGAILIQWNLASPDTPSGLWDVHTRIGGFTGSELGLAECPKTPETEVTPENLPKECIGAFMSMHITPCASGLYLQNVWLWVADHDIEDPNLTQITVYAGRGLLVESTKGNIWGYGTSVEHHVLYEYYLYNTTSVVLGQIQTETAYYQPNPVASIPFPADSKFHDPALPSDGLGWGLNVVDSTDTFLYGVGLYSFFDNNNVTCSNEGNTNKCQDRILNVENSHLSLYALNTVGTAKMITVGGTDVADYTENSDLFVQTIALLRV